MKKNAKKLKVVLVHDILTKLGGAERVLLEFTKVFPDAEIHTLVYDKKFTSQFLTGKKVRSSFLQFLPKKLFRFYLPLMPRAVQSLKIPQDADLVLVDSASFAKGIKVPPHIPYVLYLHTPTRFLWKDRDWYLHGSGRVPFVFRSVLNKILRRIKAWDYVAMGRPDLIIANSNWIASECQKYYSRNADFVVFPPVNIENFSVSQQTDDYFLLVGRVEPYKNVELAIQAAHLAGIKLKIVGDGSQRISLEEKYQSDNIEFLGKVSDKDLARFYSSARALIFPQEEDAGIVPLESFASGTPVIALKAGGALESVIPGKTGEFFIEETPEALASAIKKFNKKRYNKIEIRKHASRFSADSFRKKIKKIIDHAIAG